MFDWEVDDRVVHKKDMDRPGTVKIVEENRLSVMVEWDDLPGELDFQWSNKLESLTPN